MQTALPAKLRTYCRSFLTSVSVCAVSHMLHSYLLGVTLIINVASYLPVTGYDSLLTVFSAAVHVSVSALCVPGACANIRVLHVWNSPLSSLMCVCVTDRLSLCLYVHARVHYPALYFTGIRNVWCVIDVHINLSRPQLTMFDFFCALQGDGLCISLCTCSWERGLDQVSCALSWLRVGD